MARVTVEDCISKVANRFELVILGSHRARELSAGSPALLPHDNDKNPVIALREIAEDVLAMPELRERLIGGYQSHSEADRPDDDDLSIRMGRGRGREPEPIDADITEEEMLAALRATEENPAN